MINLKNMFARTDEQLIRGLAVFYGIGLVLHLIPPTRPIMIAITPLAMLGAGICVLFSVSPHKNIKLTVFLAVTFAFTWAVEIAGVKTGAIFGSYQYGEALGPKIFDTPPLIGFIWCLVTTGSIALIDALFARTAATLVLAPLLCVVFDVVLEGGALFLGYWTWETPAVPAQNYLAWGLVSFAVTVFYKALRLKIDSRVPAANFIMQSLFFLLILIFTIITGDTHVLLF